MKVWKKIVALVILVPFLVSVSGVVVFHTHCNCTGQSTSSLFVVPAHCGELASLHDHLFEHHTADLNSCCSEEAVTAHHHHEKECGCNTPRVEFFKLKQQFTDEKGSPVKKLAQEVTLLLPGIKASRDEIRFCEFKATVPSEGPPVLLSGTDIIHFLCQPKIPGLI